MVISKRLAQLTRELDRDRFTSDNRYRIRYALRNPADGHPGRGRGLNGVEDERLIEVYADALDRAAKLFTDWGWPRPPGSDGSPDRPILVHAFRTEWLGQGDVPLTIPGEPRLRVYTSQVALRSTFDEPRPGIRRERAAVEAAHEAAHTFTHQFVSPLELIGDIWTWFDEATAVFAEGEVFPGFAETRRFGLYWNCCPEFSLTTVGGFGGYFAAWFVRSLVERFCPEFLLEVWQGARRRHGPLASLAQALGRRNTTLPEVFWEYCWKGYASPGAAPGMAESFGPRSLTEAFAATGGVGETDALPPLSCRYYRIDWPPGIKACAVEVLAGGPAQADEFRAGRLTVAPGCTVTEPILLRAAGPPVLRWHGVLTRPNEGRETVLVVARVRPPAEPRPAPAEVVTVQVRVAATT
jgi:hypothetical protein